MKIYIVIESEGEYSDRQESCVCAYSDEKKAQKEVERLDIEDRRKYAESHENNWRKSKNLPENYHTRFFIGETELMQ
jgi:hypothetical protein